MNVKILIILVMIVKLFVAVKDTKKSFNCFDQREHFRCRGGPLTPYRYVANYNDTKLIFPG